MLKITDTDLQNFRTHLTALDRSEATISKYLHDARVLIEFAPEGITRKI